MTETQERGRRGRRTREAERETGHPHHRHLTNPYRPLEILREDQVEAIHRAALQLLSDTGVRVMLPEAREILGGSETRIDEETEIVRFDPELVESCLQAAPSSIEMASRTGRRNMILGGTSVALLPVAGPPNATDLDRGRRAGTLQDFEDFLKLTQSFDVLHSLCPSVEPQDVELSVRHLQMTLSQLQLSDKVPFIYARGRAQVADCMEVIRIGSGDDEASFDDTPRCWTVINTNSPRQIDLPMCEGIIDFARSGQVSVITPFTLAGAMAPVSLAGALTQQHAEALAGITLAQLARRGAPVVYGAFTSNVDMRSGAPAFGTPEAFKAAIASGQLARHIGLPWRSSGVSTSNTSDAQGGYETMMNLFGALLGGANMIVHAAGWLESGLSASYEKFILDVEMLQMVAESLQPIDTSPAEIGLDAIAAVSPGGHFFGTEHTLERYRDAFYEPIVFGRSNFEQWVEAGSLDAMQRANTVWKRVLADFEPPALDDAVAAELSDYIGRRTEEGGALPRS
jgi:trimethylamine---corrinoid protein Co-methyltransferase